MQKRDYVTRITLIPIFAIGFFAGLEAYALCFALWIIINGTLRTPNTYLEEDDSYREINFVGMQTKESSEELITLSV
ncbi:MAG: hypothetical protein Q8Q95_02065 [bacterium]|nr:hypothetical protein [bacterium]